MSPLDLGFIFTGLITSMGLLFLILSMFSWTVSQSTDILVRTDRIEREMKTARDEEFRRTGLTVQADQPHMKSIYAERKSSS